MLKYLLQIIGFCEGNRREQLTNTDENVSEIETTGTLEISVGEHTATNFSW